MKRQGRIRRRFVWWRLRRDKRYPKLRRVLERPVIAGGGKDRLLPLVYCGADELRHGAKESTRIAKRLRKKGRKLAAAEQHDAFAALLVTLAELIDEEEAFSAGELAARSRKSRTVFCELEDVARRTVERKLLPRDSKLARRPKGIVGYRR